MFQIYWETNKYLQNKREVFFFFLSGVVLEVLGMLLKVMKLSIAFIFTAWIWKMILGTLETMFFHQASPQRWIVI